MVRITHRKEKLLASNSYHWSITGILSLLVLVLAVFSHGLITGDAAPAMMHTASNSGVWSTYLFNTAHTGFNQSETTITASTAGSLKYHWSSTTRGGVSSQPEEANGNVYWGSWDGYEHAASLNGAVIWATNLGQTSDSSCNPQTAGVAGAATIASFTINNVMTPMVFVGGGNANFYALNANSGAVIWHTVLGSSPSHFIWDAPAVYNGSVYIGVSSFGDCPLVQGQMFQLNATTGSVEHMFTVVLSGCLGGGIWGSPTIDSNAGTLYFATGNASKCSSSTPYAQAVVELHTSDLSLVGSWQVPASQAVKDGDFGSTPILFSASGRNLVGIPNKNGIYYAFKRDALRSGPVWQAQIAKAGKCPECDWGSISPAAWDGTYLYVAGGTTFIKGTTYKGSVRALNPTTGKFIWQLGLNGGPVLAAVTVVPGVAIVTEGTSIVLIATSSGQILKTLTDTNSGSLYYGAASVSLGVLYVGNMDGRLYAYGL